jgi:predicted nucleic acid-binding protein
VAADPVGTCYIDTSALIKRYVEEDGSDAFEAFCESPRLDGVVSPLGVTEFGSVLQRRLRTGELTQRHTSAMRQRLLADISTGGWRIIAFEADVFSTADHLLSDLGAPLSTLDALHLACALRHGAPALATADRQLAAAARKAKLQVHLF